MLLSHFIQHFLCNSLIGHGLWNQHAVLYLIFAFQKLYHISKKNSERYTIHNQMMYCHKQILFVLCMQKPQIHYDTIF